MLLDITLHAADLNATNEIRSGDSSLKTPHDLLVENYSLIFSLQTFISLLISMSPFGP